MLEPVLSQSVTPMSWERFIAHEGLAIFHTERTALVSIDSGDVCAVWLVAGALEDVPGLLAQCEDRARGLGMKKLQYLGRKGWVRALEGVKIVAVIGEKEL